MTRPLNSAEIRIFSPEAGKFCYIKKYRYRLHFNVFSESLKVVSLKVVMLNMVRMLITSVHLTTLGLLKIIVFKIIVMTS